VCGNSGPVEIVEISASLLAADYAQLGREVKRAEAAGVDSFHFDMMDGHYVPNLAFTPQHLTALRSYTHLPFCTHLELTNPDEVLSKFSTLDTDMIIVQKDTLPNPEKTFELIKKRGCKVGLGLSPVDSIENCASYFSQIDLLLILGVFPGFGGQIMQPNTIAKIALARKISTDLNAAITIAVDGGVNHKNSAGLISAGANCLIMGSALFQAGRIKQVIKQIRGPIEV
jgi:ribulose-phosphate 3-epimerase